MRIRRLAFPLLALGLWVGIPPVLPASADEVHPQRESLQGKALGLPAPSMHGEAEGAGERNRLEGDTMDDPFWIDSLPFYGSGNTCGYTDDYSVMCPYGSWARDVVYAFAPAQETNIQIDLCSSLYDTMVHLYNDAWQQPRFLGCNDDFCGDDGYKSMIQSLHVVPGLTYYIVVDGYTSACGEYDLRVTDLGPCVPQCSGEWIHEDETICGEGQSDEYNGGCNTWPARFLTIPPSPHIIRICGEGGWFGTIGSWDADEDWYEIRPAQSGRIDIFCEAEFNAEFALIDGNQGCPGTYLDWASAEYCGPPVGIGADVDAGIYWIRVRPAYFVDCGADYRIWIDGYVPDPSSIDPAGPELVDSGRIRLDPPRPNPFHVATRFGYALTRPGPVRLQVVDLAGRLVRTLRAFPADAAGSGQVIWDGRDEVGREVPSGVYRCLLEGRGMRVAQTVVRLR